MEKDQKSFHPSRLRNLLWGYPSFRKVLKHKYLFLRASGKYADERSGPCILDGPPPEPFPNPGSRLPLCSASPHPRLTALRLRNCPGRRRSLRRCAVENEEVLRAVNVTSVPATPAREGGGGARDAPRMLPGFVINRRVASGSTGPAAWAGGGPGPQTAVSSVY